MIAFGNKTLKIRVGYTKNNQPLKNVIISLIISVFQNQVYLHKNQCLIIIFFAFNCNKYVDDYYAYFCNASIIFFFKYLHHFSQPNKNKNVLNLNNICLHIVFLKKYIKYMFSVHTKVIINMPYMAIYIDIEVCIGTYFEKNKG